jgi:O-antigen/teichoic acid export membrane protein
MALILATLASWFVLIAALNSFRWQATNPVVQVIAIAGALLVARPTVLALRLDTPFPDDEWVWRDLDSVLVRTQLAAILFISVVAVAAQVARSPVVRVDESTLQTRRQQRTRRRSRWLPSNQRLALWLPALAATAVLVTVPFWVRYGGFQGLTASAKGREIVGPDRLMRAPSVAAAYLGMALALVTDDNGHRPWLRRGLAAYVVGAAVAYSWGARDAAVYPLLLPLVALASRPTRLSAAAVKRVLFKTPAVLVVLALVFGAGFALRVLRDVTISGNVQETIAGESFVRRMSVATNQTQFDAFMLVMADTPEPLPRGGIESVAAASRALVPGVIRPSGPTLEAPAVQVARFYEPARLNGWPLTVAGDWYWALGWVGVATGAAITGVLFGRLDAWRRRQSMASSAATSAYVLVATTTVALGGVGLMAPSRALNVGLPIVLVGAILAVVPALGRPRAERFAIPDERAALERGLDWTRHVISQVDRPQLVTTPRTEPPLPPPDPITDTGQPRLARRSTRGDLVVTLGANVFGVIVGLAIAIVSTRSLGQTEFGRLSWAMTATYVGGVVATLGLTLGTVALAGRYDNPETMRRFIGTSFNVTLVAAIALAVTLSAGAVVAPGLVGAEFVDLARLCGFMIVPTAVLSVASSAFRARGRFAEAAVTSEQVARAAVLMALMLAIASGNTNANYVVAMAALYLMVAAFLAYAALRVSPTTPLVEPLPTFLRRLVPFFLASVGATLIPQIGVITLGLVSDADEVAILSAAIRVQMLCTLLLAAAGRTIGPRIAAHRGPLSEMTPLLRNTSTLVFWATAAMAAPFVLGGPWLIPLVFGDEFADAWVPLVVLLVGTLVNVGTGLSGQVLINSGHERATSLRVVASGLAFIPLSALGGWVAGPVGVAVMATVVVSTVNIWQVRAAVRWTGAKTWTYLTPRHVGRTARILARREVEDRA